MNQSNKEISSLRKWVRAIKKTKIVHSAINVLKRTHYSNECAALKKNYGESRCILMLTPSYGNLGDQALAVAGKLFLKDNFSECPIIEITDELYRINRKYIRKYISQNDVLLINGGGFTGSLYLEMEILLQDILKQFKNNKIVILPQTIYYSDSREGNELKEQDKTLIANCLNLTLCLRDECSLELAEDMLKNCGNAKYYYLPDMVTYLNSVVPYRTSTSRNGKALFCIRADKERVLDEECLKEITDFLKANNVSVEYTDTVIRKNLYGKEREKRLYEKWKEFAGYNLVITDRIHGMLFAAITGTPCIAFDNCSQKVSGAYDWIAYLDYIKTAVNSKEAIRYIKDIFNDNSAKIYYNTPLAEHYETLANAIK